MAGTRCPQLSSNTFSTGNLCGESPSPKFKHFYLSMDAESIDEMSCALKSNIYIMNDRARMPKG
jgi:hypothetical protein